MSRRTTWLAALGSAIALCGTLAALAAAQPIFVQVGDLEISFNATIKPKRLPPKKRAPISTKISSRLTSKDHAHIPAMTRATIEIDKDVAIDSRGVPACTAGQLENQTTEGVEAACRDAIVGSGSVTVEIAFPGASPIQTGSRLLAVNGGSAGGATTVYFHAYISTPLSQSLVVPVVLTKRSKGIYGLRAQVSIPKIAGGAGSLAGFQLTFKRTVAAPNGGHGYLTARCSDGNLVFEPEVEFEEGALARGLLARGCTPKRGG